MVAEFRRREPMISPPYKIKEVKKLPRLATYERWRVLKNGGFNTYNISSDYVTFDLVAKGMSAWSHFQKGGYMVGDEAYAGSRNYLNLLSTAERVLGLDGLVPTHNGVGAEKLLVTTVLGRGQLVVGNRGQVDGLVSDRGGKYVDITGQRAAAFAPPEHFGADADLARLTQLAKGKAKKQIAYVHLETCPEFWNGQPLSLQNLKAVSQWARKLGVPLVLDISNAVQNAFWILEAAGKRSQDLGSVVREMVALADVVLMDASQDCRSDVGGFIGSRDEALFERFRNQVVVFEGLHTYGGMTGRAMEVFALGLQETERPEYTQWHAAQIRYLFDLLRAENVPAYLGACGVALDVKRFLPHLKQGDSRKFVIAASLFVYGGIRPRIDGTWRRHAKGPNSRILSLDLPRHALTRSHLEKIAGIISTAYQNRREIMGLALLNRPEFVDEAVFEPKNHRLFVSFPPAEGRDELFEPYKIAIFEPIFLRKKRGRMQAIARAGYNTFLLDSRDVYIDFLTDSGTSAMSGYQWEGMTNSTDTPFSSRHFNDLVEEFRSILGFKHIIPTHQGRAAEHIMSQVMIKSGQSVPGNMYFTTTKLHQEMAGGIFADVIVDQAHDPQSDYPWKGNIDLDKLRAEIERVGAKNVAYVSFELAVNMAGGQPFSMDNAKAVSRLCQKHGIPVMYDATRCVENAQMIKLKDPAYANKRVEQILREIMSYGDGCTVSCKKDFMVNMGGLLACNNDQLAERFRRMLRIWEGPVTTGGLDPKDLEALRRGLLESLDDDYIAMRVHQTQTLGEKLMQVGIPIVKPPGTHAIFIDAKRFLPHVDQREFPAQALAAAVYVECGVRSMERGTVSKGRDPKTGQNILPALELIRLTIPRRVYTDAHFDFVVEGLARLWDKRERIGGLKFTYEPKVLRFFQGRFEPVTPWGL